MIHITRKQLLQELEMLAGTKEKRELKTHCLHGHPLSGENLLITGKQSLRHCRACNRRRAMAYYYRKKQNEG